MTALLVTLLLATPGTIRVQVEGAATEVVAFSEGRIKARAPVRDGVAVLTDLPSGETFSLRAQGGGALSRPVTHVRPVSGEGGGFDAVLKALPTSSVRIGPTALIWVPGVWPPRLAPDAGP